MREGLIDLAMSPPGGGRLEEVDWKGILHCRPATALHNNSNPADTSGG